MKMIDFEDLATPLRADPATREEIKRERLEALAEIVEYNLAEIRKAKKVTQTELASFLGVRQPAVSELERSEDPRLSSIRAFIGALGGRIEVFAVFDDERVALDV